MVNSLELKAAMEEVQPGRTVHIHSGAEHLLREGLVDSEIRRRHGEVRKRDLHVQGSCDHVGDEKEKNAVAPVWDGSIKHAISKPRPEKYLAAQFEPAVPPSWALLWSLAQEEIFPTQPVKIKATKEKDWVVQVVLKFQQELSYSIEGHDAVVIRAAEVGHKAMRDCEEWHVFDVRVMLWRIGHNMVDVVIALPPSQAETSQIVCNNDSDDRVDMKVVSNAHMAGIMSREDELVPEAAKKECRRAIPTPAEKEIREHRTKGISTALDEIRPVIAVVETFRADPLVQGAVLFHDVVLGGWF